MVPVDLGEHHIPSKHHHLCGRAALGCNRQTISRFVDDQRIHQAIAIEVFSVWHAAVLAIPNQVIHLVDVDWP